MTNTEPSDRTNTDAPVVSDIAKGVTIAAAVIWLLTLLILLTIDLPGLLILIPYFLLLVTTVLLLFYGVPVLFLSWVGRR